MNSFTFGKNTITYALERQARKTLAITVQPDLGVRVRAPQNVADAEIEQILKKRAPWILRQQRFFAQFHPRTPPRRYVSGETHLYLGRQYRLRVCASESETVKLMGGYLYIDVQEPANPDRVKQLLNRWYAVHAESRFSERLDACLQIIAGWDVPNPKLSCCFMTKRWGSCSPSKRLTLNCDLIRAPRACIDYVILHELCHLRHPNHTREFYRLLTSVLPDWRERKQLLERKLS